MKSFLNYIIITALLISCTENEVKQYSELKKITSFKIEPPLKSYKSGIQLYEIDNSKDTILVSDKGSYISIPKNCFNNSEGDLINSNITIQFKEYLNPATILLSGIPMEYLENKDTMNFQSAGMCEIVAKQNNDNLKIKAGKELTIGLRSMAHNKNYNLYYFDTLKGSWIEKEKSVQVQDSKTIPIPPIKLSEANPDKIINIKIEDYINRPLYKMWHKSKFVLYGETNSNKQDTTIWWYDMSVSVSDNPNVYKLSFNGVDDNTNQCTQQLLVLPAIDSINYQSEMNGFYAKMRNYVSKKDLITQQIEKEKQETERIEKMADTRIIVMRSFTINKMGIYNCDRFYIRPIIKTKQIGFKIDNELTKFDDAYLINKYDNAILRSIPVFNKKYKIDFDSKTYHFIGIINGDIYTNKIQLNDSQSNYTINKIELDEFKRIMQ